MRKKVTVLLMLCMMGAVAGCGSAAQSEPEIAGPAAVVASAEENDISQEKETEMDFSAISVCLIKSMDEETAVLEMLDKKEVVLSTELLREKSRDELKTGDYVSLFYNTLTENSDGTFTVDLVRAEYDELDPEKRSKDH